MRFLYTIINYIVAGILPIVALFNSKIKLFVQGRRKVFPTLNEKISSTDQVIWIHSASLGEFEQGLPIIKALKQKYPQKKIIVTFFSPSGYEVKKNTLDADVVVYLPLDIPSKVKKFLDVIRPEMAIFVKYEFWVNYLLELRKRNIPTYLISGIFRKNQIFFKPYGGFMRNVLRSFTHFFVQDENSKELLHSIGFKNISVSGDTRFDRVWEILQRDNTLDFIQKFKGDSLCVVFGSSWPADEDIFLSFINYLEKDVKCIIAPHNINSEKIDALRRKISKKIVLFSDKENKSLDEYDIFIIDTIGILTKIYSYADIVYVGGGMQTGLHNVLEPAVFGIPVIIGKNYDKFLEAKELIDKKGIISISDEKSFNKEIKKLISDKQKRKEMGEINQNYIKNKKGATQLFITNCHNSLNSTNKI